MLTAFNGSNLKTKLRPDLVIIDSINRTIIIIELTVCFETNVDNAHSRKIDRYASLINDLNELKWSASLFTLEIGCRGLVNKNNRSRLKSILKTVKSQTKSHHLVTQLSKCAILCSFVIFNSRKESTWNDFKLLDF